MLDNIRLTTDDRLLLVFPLFPTQQRAELTSCIHKRVGESTVIAIFTKKDLQTPDLHILLSTEAQALHAM